jgi:hypothetical protein
MRITNRVGLGASRLSANYAKKEHAADVSEPMDDDGIADRGRYQDETQHEQTPPYYVTVWGDSLKVE